MDWANPGVIFGFLLAYLFGSVIIGLYFGRRGAKDQEGYFVAGRDLGMVPTAFSILAAALSGGVFLGSVGLFYTLGSQMMGYVLAFAAILPVATWIVGRRLWAISARRRYVTLQGFLGDYYNSHVLRLGGAVVAIVFLVPYFASNAIALGLVLEQTTGIPYAYGVWLMIVGTVLYSAYGGISAVAYTDVYQGLIAVVFAILAAIGLVAASGGLGTVFTAVPDHAALPPLDTTLVALFFGWLFFVGFGLLVLPDRVTRVMSARNLRQLGRGAVLVALLLPLVTTCFLLYGHTLQVLVPGMENPDGAFPAAITQFVPILVPLMVVVVWATGMSTLDSGIVSASTIFSRDIGQSYISNSRFGAGLLDSDVKVVGKTRILVIVMALAAIAIATYEPPAIWTIIGLYISIFLQYFPALVGGLYWKRGTRSAAEISFSVGIIVTIGLTLFVTLPPGFFPGMVALVPNILLYIAISYVTKPLPEEHVESFHMVYREAGVGDGLVRVQPAVLTDGKSAAPSEAPPD